MPLQVYSFAEHEVFASPDGLTGLQSVGYVYAPNVTPTLIGPKLYFVWTSEKGERQLEDCRSLRA